MAKDDLNAVLRNLSKEISKIQNQTFVGMRKVGLFVENESNEIVPHDKGVLINSSFSATDVTGSKIKTRVGYTAKYAAIVHEMPKSFNYTKPGTGPKFLEKAAKNNVSTILSIVQRAAKVK